MDLTGFVSTQAKMALHPLFRQLQDGARAHPVTERRNKSIFTIVAMSKNNLWTFQKVKKVPKGLTDSRPNNAFSKPCLFCNGNHCMAECKKMRRVMNKVKKDFLRGKGACALVFSKRDI